MTLVLSDSHAYSADSFFTIQVLQTTLSTVGAAICVSYTCRDNLILRARIDPQKVYVIPNAVDPSKFLPDPSRRSKDRYVYEYNTDMNMMNLKLSSLI